MAQSFNIKRVSSLMYRNLVLLRGAIITTLLVAGGLILVATLLSIRGDHVVKSNEFIGVFSVLFLSIGLLFTFAIFREMHSGKSSYFYFLLPVTALERVIAAWLLSNVIYIIVFTFFAFVIGQIAILLCSFSPSTGIHFLPIFSETFWTVVKFYFFVQPAFLLGAVVFSKNRIGKTLLAAIVVFFCVFIYNLILCFAFTGGAFDVFTSDPFSTDAFDLATKDVSGIGAFLFSLVFGPMMLLVTYFRITEKEIR